MPGDLFSTLPKIVQRTLWAGTRGLRRSPLAVISDGDLPSSVASALVRVPVIAIGHGLVFSHCQRPAGVDAEAWAREARKAARASRGSVRQVPVSFCALTTTGSGAVLSRHTLRPGERRTPSGGVVCYFRDDNGQHVLSALRACGVTPRVFSQKPSELPGVRCEPPHRARFLEAVAQADAVVSSAGHQLISETLELGVPHLALYAAGDDEQKLNVEMLRSARLGDGAALEHVDRAQIVNFLGHLPEIEQLRSEFVRSRSLPALDDVVLNLVRELESGAAQGATKVGTQKTAEL